MVRSARASPPAAPCTSPCDALAPLVRGQLLCNYDDYSFDWGNKICVGILPKCVLRPRDAQDVAAAVRFARQRGLPLSYRSGGHSYTCNGIKHDSLHLDLRTLDHVELVKGPTGRPELALGPGNTQRMLLDALPPGQMIVHGQCPTVGAGGLFLHGGYHTTLSLKYGRGNDTVTSMEVVTGNGTVLQLSDDSPHAGLWKAMRQAGSSFAIATRIQVRVIDDLPPTFPTDGGHMFALKLPRKAMIALTDNATREAGLTTYFHINGVDVVSISASTSYSASRAWLEQRLGRSLTLGERVRSGVIHLAAPIVSASEGADRRFGVSGELPYALSSQDAYSTVTFAMPMECYVAPAMRSLLADLPDHRDPHTDFGCYLQLTTTYMEGLAMIDFNCAYDSAFYQEEQRALNKKILALCPGAVQRYVNTPSAFLTPRDYYPNYDELAAIKARWDPEETFRVYQGVRPTGRAPDAYEWKRDYVRQRACREWLAEKLWALLVRFFF